MPNITPWTVKALRMSAWQISRLRCIGISSSSTVTPLKPSRVYDSAVLPTVRVSRTRLPRISDGEPSKVKAKPMLRTLSIQSFSSGVIDYHWNGNCSTIVSWSRMSCRSRSASMRKSG
jgi:hypothetical protein